MDTSEANRRSKRHPSLLGVDTVKSSKQLLKNMCIKTEKCVILPYGSTTRRTHTTEKTRRLY